MLERLVIEPESLDALIGLLEVLRRGESVERQFLAGVEPEQLGSILLGIGEETPSLRDAVQIFLAEQFLRERDTPRAREILNAIDWTKITDARILLFAVNIREAMGTPADLEEAESLLAAVGQFAMERPSLIKQVVVRYWNSGRLDEAFELLAQALQASPENPELNVTGALLSAISNSDDSEVWVRALDRLIKGNDLSLATREWVELAEMILDGNLPDLLLASPGTVNQWMNETLLLCAVGDLSVESQKLKTAIKAYQLALGSTDAGSHPINSRLLSVLWRTNAVTDAFRVAYEYVENSQSIRSIIFFCDAWIRLKNVGLEPSDAVSGFEKWESVEELLFLVQKSMEERKANATLLEPLFVRDAIAAQNIELARERP